MTPLIRIGDREVAPGRPVYVIAEAGVNHDGSVARAHELVDRAADAHADAVKFQTFDVDALVSADAPRARYQQGRLGDDGTQRSMLATLELPRTAWAELYDHAHERGLEFLSTPFDEMSLNLLLELGIPAVKIGSGDVTNRRLLTAAAASGRPVLCSTGTASFGEVADAIDVVRTAGGDLAILHCVSSYPTPLDQANLTAIPKLADLFDVVVGYSDHTLGRLAAVAATALGASVLEKHLTTDKSLPGPDHRASLDPDEFAALVIEVRAIEAMMGTGMKGPQPAEVEVKSVARRSLTYARDLPAGAVLHPDDLGLKRPADGLPPELEPSVIGRRLRRPVRIDERVSLSDLE